MRSPVAKWPLCMLWATYVKILLPSLCIKEMYVDVHHMQFIRALNAITLVIFLLPSIPQRNLIPLLYNIFDE